MKLREFFAQDKYKNSSIRNVAGYVDKDNNLHYIDSTNPALPAAVKVVEKANNRKLKVYTNLPTSHWLRTYLKDQVKQGDYLTKPDQTIVDQANMEVVPKALGELALPACPQGPELSAPLGGGLYQAAKAMMGGGADPDGGAAKGYARALRYYMLAAYTLLRLCKLEGYKGIGNYVAALMVDDSGKILSTGINTGSYRHAEVSMLLNYFGGHAQAKKFEEKTIVFSTLTPCKQCTGYLTDSKPVECVIYFGQEDVGKLGKVGKKISAGISERTKAPRGRVETSADAEAGDGAVGDASAGGIRKVQMAKGLSDCMDAGQSIAAQISENAQDVLHSAAAALVHKIDKDRTGLGEEDQIKDKVLRYLDEWLGSIKL